MFRHPRGSRNVRLSAHVCVCVCVYWIYLSLVCVCMCVSMSVRVCVCPYLEQDYIWPQLSDEPHQPSHTLLELHRTVHPAHTEST